MLYAAYRGVYSSAPISKAGRKPDQIARARILFLLQDLVPDYFGCGLILIAHAQIIAEVLIVVEPNHATVVVAAPVLRADTYKHLSRSHSIYPALQIVAQMLILNSTS